MRSKIFLIAIVIFLVCLLLEQLKRTKKEGLDKLSIGGLSVAIIGVVIVLISSIFVQKKNKYFFPIIPFIISCVIIGISIFQIVQKENEYAADEIQPVAIEESGFESDSSISAENDFSDDKKVSTHKSLFAIDLLEDFIVLNIPTILCTLDIAKKKRN